MRSGISCISVYDYWTRLSNIIGSIYVQNAIKMTEKSKAYLLL